MMSCTEDETMEEEAEIVLKNASLIDLLQEKLFKIAETRQQ